jgi:hypothetical protein
VHSFLLRVRDPHASAVIQPNSLDDCHTPAVAVVFAVAVLVHVRDTICLGDAIHKCQSQRRSVTNRVPHGRSQSDPDSDPHLYRVTGP